MEMLESFRVAPSVGLALPRLTAEEAAKYRAEVRTWTAVASPAERDSRGTSSINGNRHDLASIAKAPLPRQPGIKTGLSNLGNTCCPDALLIVWFFRLGKRLHFLWGRLCYTI